MGFTGGILTVPLFHSHLNCVKVCRRGFFLLSLKRIRSECSGEQKTGSRKGSGSRTNGADYCAATTCRSARLTGRPSSRLSAFSIASLLKLRDRLEKEFGVDCFLTTSRAAAAWAEYHFGPYAGTGNLIVVGIGVGIGAAIISEHTLLPNRPDRPTGYIGHLYLPGIQRRCVCGEFGCIEAFAGGRSLASLAQERFPGQTVDAAQLDRLADEGNREARELIGRAADYDAFAVAFLLQMYHPDALIFYGGQCRKEGFLYNELLRRLDFHVPPVRRRGMSISISDLGERHVALGAARLYFEKLF